jgi:hypothetical protein
MKTQLMSVVKKAMFLEPLLADVTGTWNPITCSWN